MARLEWVIVTERTIIEAESGNVSLLSIVETISLPPHPEGNPGKNLVLPFRMYVNQQWARSDPDLGERAMTRTVFSGPSKKVIASMQIEVDLESAERTRSIVVLPAFPLMGEGVYPFVIQLRSGSRWRSVGRTQIAVRFDSKVSPATTK